MPDDCLGMIVSVDVSTGEDDAFDRIFARVTDRQYDPATGEAMLLAEAIDMGEGLG